MTRFLTLIALVGLLAACTGQGDTTTDSPDATASPMTSAPDATTEASDDASGTGTASAECSAAFDGLAGMEIQTMSELGDLTAEVEPTIEACATVAEWIDGAQAVVADEINPNTARLLLGIQCNDPSLSGSDLCRDLASS